MPDNTPSTVGLEFESIMNTREQIMSMLPWDFNKPNPIYSVTKDASVESRLCYLTDKTSIFLGRKILRDNLVKNIRPEYTSGFEIVTRPLDMDEMRSTISKVISSMSKSGEIFSPRSSIHVHVGYPRGFIFLKTAVNLGLKIEPLMYKIAGMGHPYRGQINNSAYARCLSNPPAIKTTEGKIVQLDVDGAKDAPDFHSFWNRLGIDPGANHSRYVPLRYFGLNIYSTLLRGSMEYRYFNFSYSSQDVQAVTALCQLITELMVKASLNSIDNISSISVFDKNSDDDYIYLLNELIDLGEYLECAYQMREDDVITIKELIAKTPQPIFDKKPILTHLDTSIDAAKASVFGLRSLTEAFPPGIINIHNFGKQDLSLVGG